MLMSDTGPIIFTINNAQLFVHFRKMYSRITAFHATSDIPIGNKPHLMLIYKLETNTTFLRRINVSLQTCKISFQTNTCSSKVFMYCHLNDIFNDKIALNRNIILFITSLMDSLYAKLQKKRVYQQIQIITNLSIYHSTLTVCYENTNLWQKMV